MFCFLDYVYIVYQHGVRMCIHVYKSVWRRVGPAGTRDFCFTLSGWAVGYMHPPIQWVLGVLSHGIKWPGHEADHSRSSGAEIKNGGAIPPLPRTSS
jgi:hypothetical protein